MNGTNPLDGTGVGGSGNSSVVPPSNGGTTGYPSGKGPSDGGAVNGTSCVPPTTGSPAQNGTDGGPSNGGNGNGNGPGGGGGGGGASGGCLSPPSANGTYPAPVDPSNTDAGCVTTSLPAVVPTDVSATRFFFFWSE